MDRGFTQGEVVLAADASTALLEYWARLGVLSPTLDGARYTAEQLSLAGVLADAAALGVPSPALRSIADRLDVEPVLWPEALWVDVDGVAHDSEPAGHAWLLRPLARKHRTALLALAS